MPDREYSIKLSENDVVRLRLEKIVPKSYDERMGFRGLTKSDLRGISKVVIMDMRGNFQTRTVNVNEIDSIKEYSMVVRFEDEEGNQYPVGLTPLDSGQSSDAAFIPEQVYLNAEIERDRLGRLRYTRATFLDKGDGYPLDKILPALNKLIDVYRLISGEYWLNEINEDDILFTSQTGSDGDSIGFSYKGMIEAKPDINNEEQTLLSTLISGTNTIPTFKILLLEATKALDERNHDLAIIYSITALESVAKQYFEKIAISKGLSRKTFKNIRLFPLVTALMRLILSKDELSDVLIENFEKANQLRNDIVHKASLKVDRNESLRAFETVQQLIALLERHEPM